MARRQKQILTATEQQEIRQLQQENRQIQARLAKLAGAGRAATTNRQTQTTAAKQAQQPKIPRVAIRPMIPEAELQPSNYLVEQYMLTHPWLTRSEALGDLCVQGFHTALPRVKRQEQARLQKQTQIQTPQQPRATTAQQPA
jgi:hypothetical protein